MSTHIHVRYVLCGLAAVTATALGIPALAQQGAPPPPPPHEGHPPPHNPADMLCKDADARQAGMLAFAEVKLQITAAQKPAWTQFIDKANEAEAPIHELCQTIQGKAEPKALPERLQMMEAFDTARLGQLRQFRQAVDVLYPQLTAEQKETADHALDQHGPGPGPGGFEHGPGMPPPPPHP
jgi:hypothetical protein